jgi:SAM-dependent methyltransferase
MNPLRIAARKLRWSLIHRGLRETLRLPVRRFKAAKGPRITPPLHPFDIEHHVDTSGLIGAVHLPANHPHDIHATAYYAIPPSRFKAILARWQATPPERPRNDYTFIDIGCGKGRAALLASELPFKEVIGVELNPALAHIARANAASWAASQPHAAPIRIVTQDATELDLPVSPCVLYLYNPFSPHVAARLIRHIEASLRANPRSLDILYFTPDAGHLFSNHPNFTTLWSESIPISQADQALEPSISIIDRCTAYRWTGF